MQVTPEQLQSWLHPGNRRTEWGPDEKGNFSPFLIPPIVIPPWKNLKTRDSVEVEGEKLWLFWGDIHGHSGLSDGRRTLDEFYAFARKIARLDFAAHTPHDSNTPYDYCTDAKWSLNLETAMMHNDPGEFIALPGYEWSHKWSKHPQKLRYGHCNIYSLEENFPLFRCENPNSDTPKKLLNNLKKHKVIVVLNHPAESKYHMDIDLWVNLWDSSSIPLIEIYSMGGCYEYDGSPLTHPTSKEKLKCNNYVQYALLNGMRVGFVGSSDSHNGHIGWDTGNCHSHDIGKIESPMFRGGLTGVYATELTREAIFDGLKKRHTITTTGERIFLDFRVNGHLMGEEVSVSPNNKSVVIQVRCRGTGPIAQCEVVRENLVVYNVKGNGQISLSFKYIDCFPGRFYYVRVTQIEGNMAWSSPIWLNI